MAFEHRIRDTSSILWGIILLFVGSAVLLDNLDLIDLGSLWRHWPFIPVAVGIGKVLGARNRKDRGDGMWWLFVGAWLYISVFEVYGLGFRESWPLLLVGWGASLVWNSLRGEEKKHKRIGHQSAGAASSMKGD